MLRRLVEATAGRRLLLRIWLHGVLLFVGVIALLAASRWAMSRQDAAMAVRTHPDLALGLAERALALAGDPAALAGETARLQAATSVALGVFGDDDAPLAPTTVAPATAVEHVALAAPLGYALSVSGDRLVVGRYRGARLEAYAVAAVPPRQPATLYALGLAVAALVLALLVVAAPLTRSIARPLERLRAVSRELGEGNLAVRAPHDRRDEIGELARTLNHMAAQMQRLRAVERDLLADVSHELRTPLSRMRVVLELASDADPVATRRYLCEITADLSELEDLLDRIITSSRLERRDGAEPLLRPVVIDVGELVEATTARFAERWPGRRLACHAGAAGLAVDADPVLLRRALDNLVDNARKYSADDAPIALGVSRAELRGGPAVRIEVQDHGLGIDAADQPSVFTAFFRADKSRTRDTGGVGLGLVLTRRIVEAHRGEIGFASERGRGSRFWFVLPLAARCDALA